MRLILETWRYLPKWSICLRWSISIIIRRFIIISPRWSSRYKVVKSWTSRRTARRRCTRLCWRVGVRTPQNGSLWNSSGCASKPARNWNLCVLYTSISSNESYITIHSVWVTGTTLGQRWLHLGSDKCQTSWTGGHMMTSWHGKLFRITGPLCGESIGELWIPLTNGQ